MSVFVAVVGVMMLKELRIEGAHSPAEVERQVREAVIDRDTGEWKLDTFTVGEGTVKIAEVAGEPSRQDVIADARSQRDRAVRARERLAVAKRLSA